MPGGYDSIHSARLGRRDDRRASVIAVPGASEYDPAVTDAQPTIADGVERYLRTALKASGILQVLTPDDAVKTIQAFTANVPLESYYTWTILPGYPVKKINEHLELFAKKVMPHFRSA